MALWTPHLRLLRGAYRTVEKTPELLAEEHLRKADCADLQSRNISIASTLCAFCGSSLGIKIDIGFFASLVHSGAALFQ